MKNTLKPLPPFVVNIPITAQVRHNESENKPEEQCAFCDKPDVFLKGLCPICFEDHYGD
jgi:hypothetical protein